MAWALAESWLQLVRKHAIRTRCFLHKKGKQVTWTCQFGPINEGPLFWVNWRPHLWVDTSCRIFPSARKGSPGPHWKRAPQWLWTLDDGIVLVWKQTSGRLQVRTTILMEMLNTSRSFGDRHMTGHTKIMQQTAKIYWGLLSFVVVSKFLCLHIWLVKVLTLPSSITCLHLGLNEITRGPCLSSNPIYHYLNPGAHLFCSLKARLVELRSVVANLPVQTTGQLWLCSSPFFCLKRTKCSLSSSAGPFTERMTKTAWWHRR